jgi:hypothetical protein
LYQCMELNYFAFLWSLHHLYSFLCFIFHIFIIGTAFVLLLDGLVTKLKIQPRALPFKCKG